MQWLTVSDQRRGERHWSDRRRTVVRARFAAEEGLYAWGALASEIRAADGTSENAHSVSGWLPAFLLAQFKAGGARTPGDNKPSGVVLAVPNKNAPHRRRFEMTVRR